MIGEGSIVADNSVINPNVTIYHDVHIGARCLVHSGVVLGADGFGFAQEDGEWVKIASLAVSELVTMLRLARVQPLTVEP